MARALCGRQVDGDDSGADAGDGQRGWSEVQILPRNGQLTGEGQGGPEVNDTSLCR